MKWEFFKYAEIGGTRAVVSRMCECPRCGGVHTTPECDCEIVSDERVSGGNSSVGERVAFPWEANSFPYKRDGAR